MKIKTSETVSKSKRIVGFGVLLKPNSKVSKIENKNNKKKLNHKSSSAKEMKQISDMSAETESESCMFALQMNDTNMDTNLSLEDSDFIEKWIKKFKKFTNSLPQENLDFFFNSSEYPLSFKPQFSAGKMFELIYKPANEVRLFGSYAQKTNIGIQSPVDVAVTLPNEFFKRDDYLNHKMIHKIAAYLMYLKRQMTQQGGQLGNNLQITLFKSNPLRPVLSIDAGKFKILIHVLPTSDLFKPSRFLPNLNNIKESTGNPSIHPTPFYNYEIISYLTCIQNSEFLENVMVKNENIRVAMKLLKLWSRQRQFDSGLYGFNGFVIGYYLIHLLKINKIQSRMSAYHIMRIFWNHVSSSKLDSEGISLCDSKTTVCDYHKYYELVMLDSTGYCNILSLMPSGLYNQIKSDCTISLHLSENSSMTTFRNLFLVKIPVILQYDHLVVLKIDEKQSKSIVERQLSTTIFKGYQNFNHIALSKIISDRLKQGLGERIKNLVPFLSETGETCFGIVLNPEHAYDIIEKGPVNDSKDAEEFRKFWGKKSEMRRFKDGTISESVLWCSANSPLGEKRLIVQKIVKYLLQFHFNIIPAKVNYIAAQFDVTIKNSYNEMNETNEETSREIIQIFDKLSKELRSIKDLPLDIVSVVGTDPVFRYADPAPPVKATVMKGYFRAQKHSNGVIQLSSSSNWPKDLEAQKRLKAAIYLKIAKQLKSCSGVFARANPNYLNILKNEQLFCFTIVHPKEIILEKLNDKNSKEKNHLMSLSKLTSALHGLHCRQPSFGPAAAMTKRWLFSKMVDGTLWPEILTELIVAEIILNPLTFSQTQPQSTFFKFLHRVSRFDPQNEMFFCNFNNDLSSEQLEEVERDFQTNRKKYPEIMVQTSLDEEQGMWSWISPSINVFNRVAMLAKRCLLQIESNYLSMSTKLVDDIFATPLTGYDIIINLNSKLVRRHNVVSNNFSKPRKALSNEERTSTPAANLNFVETFLLELRESFDKYALFFYNPVGGDKIAVILKPFFHQHKTEQISKISIVQDVEIIGRGIVSSIELFE